MDYILDPKYYNTIDKIDLFINNHLKYLIAGLKKLDVPEYKLLAIKDTVNKISKKALHKNKNKNFSKKIDEFDIYGTHLLPEKSIVMGKLGSKSLGKNLKMNYNYPKNTFLKTEKKETKKHRRIRKRKKTPHPKRKPISFL